MKHQRICACGLRSQVERYAHVRSVSRLHDYHHRNVDIRANGNAKAKRSSHSPVMICALVAVVDVPTWSTIALLTRAICNCSGIAPTGQPYNRRCNSRKAAKYEGGFGHQPRPSATGDRPAKLSLHDEMPCFA